MTTTIGPITYKAIASVSIMPKIDTTKLFSEPDRIQKSPIDIFITNTRNLNRLYLSYSRPGALALPPELGSVVVLGYMSAVESYLRSIITEIIRIDKKSWNSAAANLIQFAAAWHLPEERLAEALLENYSFSSSKNLRKAFREMLGVEKVPNDVDASLTIFERICHVRHCCVHRFGKLGTRNALDLGLDEHTSVLEGPFSPNVADILDIAEALQITVKTINNYLFYLILDRTMETTNPGDRWQLRYATDREKFLRFYKVFSLKAVRPSSPAPKVVYSSFIRDNKARLEKALRIGG